MKYYLRDEVVIHNRKNDIWIIIHGKIFELTKLLKDRMDSDTMNDNLNYLVQLAGKDLSLYFNCNGTPKTRFTSDGRCVPVFPPVFDLATSEFYGNIKDCWWWEDPMYLIGEITKQERQLRIINTLTRTILKMRVCEEDTIYEIQEKYRHYNSHFGSYTWKKCAPNHKSSGSLTLNKTLTENGLLYNLNDPVHTVWLYFNDDFTV